MFCIADWEMFQKINKYSIRKLSVGAASVLIGAAFMMQSNSVRADDLQAASNSASEPQTGQVENTNNVESSTGQSELNNENAEVVKRVESTLKDNEEVDGSQIQNKQQIIHYQDDETKEKIAQDNKQDVTFVPVYKKSKVHVTYYDKTTDSILAQDTILGYVGSDVNYSSKEQKYLDQGYKLVSNDYQASKYLEEEKEYRIILEHAIETQTITEKATRTINYYRQGEDTPFDSIVQTVDLTGTYNADKVDSSKNTPVVWSTGNFEKVDAKQLKGYHINDYRVSDDFVGNVSEEGQVSEATVSKPSNTSVNIYYTLNGTRVINQQTKEVKQTVTFRFNWDGSADLTEPGWEDERFPPNKQTLTFVYSGDIQDVITGEILEKGTWTPAQRFNKVTSPEFLRAGEILSDGSKWLGNFGSLPKTEADKLLLTGQEVTHDSKDIDIVVKYVIYPEHEFWFRNLSIANESFKINENQEVVNDYNKNDATKYWTILVNGKLVAKDVTDPISTFISVASPKIDGYFLKHKNQREIQQSEVTLASPDKKEITVFYVKKQGHPGPEINKELPQLAYGKPGDELSYDLPKLQIPEKPNENKPETPNEKPINPITPQNPSPNKPNQPEVETPGDEPISNPTTETPSKKVSNTRKKKIVLTSDVESKKIQEVSDTKANRNYGEISAASTTSSEKSESLPQAGENNSNISALLAVASLISGWFLLGMGKKKKLKDDNNEQ